jgi:threonine aldolase
LDAKSDKNAEYLGRELKEKHGVLCGVINPGRIRMVVHRQISEDNIEHVIDCVKKIM